MAGKICVLLLLLSCLVCTFAQIPTPQWIQVQAQFGAYPIPFRYGHSSAMSPFGRLVSFSGTTESTSVSVDLTRFNYLSNGNIQTLQTLSELANKPRVCAAYGLWDSNYLVTWGGYLGSGITEPPYLLIYDISGGNWLNDTSSFVGAVNDTNLSNHYNFPSYGAAAAIDNAGDNLYLYGGSSVAYVLDFVTRISLPTQTYYQIRLSSSSVPAPQRKYGAVMAYTSNPFPSLWIFGGKTGLGQEGTLQQSTDIFNEMGRFDINGRQWLSVTGTPLTGRPSPRAFMSAVVLNDTTTWIIFGGRNDYNRSIGVQILYNDLYSFDLVTNVWTTLAPTGTAPSIRDKAAACLLNWVGEDSILFYGGSDQAFSPFNDFWYLKIRSTGAPPVPPPSTLDLNNDAGGDVVVLPSASPSSGVSPSTSPLPPRVTFSSASVLTSWINVFVVLIY